MIKEGKNSTLGEKRWNQDAVSESRLEKLNCFCWVCLGSDWLPAGHGHTGIKLLWLYCWTIPCPMETPGNYIQSWHEGVQRQDSDKWHVESNLPIRTNQTLSPHAEAPSQHFISAAPSLGIVQTDCSSSHCSDTRQGTLLDNVVLGNSALCEASGKWSFVSAPAGVFSSADYLTCCTTQDSASLEPNHRAFTEQPPVQTDTRHSFWTWQPQLHGDFATFIREAFEKQK